ncbi:MAG: hypothetical protein KBG84_14880, partial [Planctomycetes bacterium]|nr:hypothetical protein [Planctomycetota bacterium]
LICIREFAKACFEVGIFNAAVLNMKINLPGIEDADFKARFGKLADAYESEAKSLLEETLAVVRNAIGA